jgi:hypothetical protein
MDMNFRIKYNSELVDPDYARLISNQQIMSNFINLPDRHVIQYSTFWYLSQVYLRMLSTKEFKI